MIIVFTQVALCVRDQEEALQYYSDGLGLEKRHDMEV
jgi:hypothetical protein